MMRARLPIIIVYLNGKRYFKGYLVNKCVERWTKISLHPIPLY